MLWFEPKIYAKLQGTSQLPTECIYIISILVCIYLIGNTISCEFLL